jgi:hypothetical protein
VGCFPEHGVFVLYDPTNELEGLVAVVFLGRDQRLVEDHAHQIGRGCGLKFLDKVPRGYEAILAFRFAADINRLESEVDAPCWAVDLVWRHDLLAEQKARLGGQFDTRTGAKPYWRTVHDHHFALAELKNEIRHFIPSA